MTARALTPHAAMLRAFFAGMSVLSAACASYTDGDEQVSDDLRGRGQATAATDWPLPKGRQVTACFYGASTGNPDDADYGQTAMERLCGRIEGTVTYGAGEIRGLKPVSLVDQHPKTTREHNALPFDNDLTLALDKVFKALDLNADGALSASEREAEVNLIGYSWGGFNAAEVAGLLGEKHPGLRVRRLVMLDPYKVNGAGQPYSNVTVPSTVDYVLNFRHAAANVCDKGCGRGMASILQNGIGGLWDKEAFTGRVPGLSGTGTKGCYATNLNKLKNDSADRIGHCDVPYFAFSAVLQAFGAEAFYSGKMRHESASATSCTIGEYDRPGTFGGPLAAPTIKGTDVLVASLNDFADGMESCVRSERTTGPR